MAINFTKNIEQYTTTNKATRAKHFMEYTSKKQLQDAGVLEDEALAFATSIKGTFSFALHEGKRYMAVTLYKATAERKYNFLILDLQEQAVAEAESIKEAKAGIMELVKEDVANAVRDIIRTELDSSNDEPEAEDEEELAKEA